MGGVSRRRPACGLRNSSAGEAIAVVMARSDRDMALLLGVLAANVGFFAFISRNVLGHYPYAWAPVLAVVTALAINELVRRGGSARVGALLLALALVAPAVQLIDRTAHIERTDYAATAELLRSTGETRPRVVLVGYPSVLRAYFPQAQLVEDARFGSVNAVVLDSRWTDHGWRSNYLDAHADAFTGHKIGQVMIYLPRS